jgi:hypothetical protein
LALGLEAGIHSRFSKKRLVSILLTGIIAYGPKGPHGRKPRALIEPDGVLLMDAGFEAQNRRADCTSFVLDRSQ